MRLKSKTDNKIGIIKTLSKRIFSRFIPEHCLINFKKEIRSNINKKNVTKKSIGAKIPKDEYSPIDWVDGISLIMNKSVSNTDVNIKTTIEIIKADDFLALR